MSYAAIEAAFVADAGAIVGVVNAVDHEPATLPELPAVTMLLRQWPQTISATGGLADVRWTWRVNLYVVLSDFKAAQDELKSLVPELLNIVRDNPTLSGTAELVTLTDTGEEPVFSTEQGYLRKSLELVALTEES